MREESRNRYVAKIPFITEKTAQGLKRKTILYLFSVKEGRRRFLYFLKKPKCFLRLIYSLLRKNKNYRQQDSCFFFDCSSFDEFFDLTQKTPDSLFVFGLSYCQKPRECPRGRFNDKCSFNDKNPICLECPVGKFRPVADEIIIIPTFLYIADRFCRLAEDNPGKKIFFIITACELSLKMFGDYASVLDLTGIGIRLVGRICNTFDAFKLAERGIKPGETFLEEGVEEDLMRLLKRFNKKKNLPNNAV
ncbi:MAG: hypothetical protein RSB82_00740 [Victivallaceae bacterium]